MNIIQEVLAAFKVKNFVQEEYKEATMDSASGKPGWKSTEFWLNLATQAGVLWGAVQGFVPPKVAAIVTVVGTAVYTIARTVAKAISDVKATQDTVSASGPVTATATVTTTPQ